MKKRRAAYTEWAKKNAEARREYMRQWRANNPAKLYEYRQSYWDRVRQRPDRLQKLAEASRERRAREYPKNKLAFREKDPQKAKCRDAVRKAVAKGALVCMPCEKCGAQPAHAHHEDYSKPLDVVWLCPTHHADLHRQRRKQQKLSMLATTTMKTHTIAALMAVLSTATAQEVVTYRPFAPGAGVNPLTYNQPDFARIQGGSPMRAVYVEPIRQEFRPMPLPR